MVEELMGEEPAVAEEAAAVAPEASAENADSEPVAPAGDSEVHSAVPQVPEEAPAAVALPLPGIGETVYFCLSPGEYLTAEVFDVSQDPAYAGLQQGRPPLDGCVNLRVHFRLGWTVDRLNVSEGPGVRQFVRVLPAPAVEGA